MVKIKIERELFMRKRKFLPIRQKAASVRTWIDGFLLRVPLHRRKTLKKQKPLLPGGGASFFYLILAGIFFLNISLPLSLSAVDKKEPPQENAAAETDLKKTAGDIGEEILEQKEELEGMNLRIQELTETLYAMGVSQKIYDYLFSKAFPMHTFPKGQLRIVMDISIFHGGKFSKVEIIENSGVEEFDKEIKRVVKKLSPYLPFSPKKNKIIKVRIPLEIMNTEEYAKAVVEKEEVRRSREAAELPKRKKPKPEVKKTKTTEASTIKSLEAFLKERGELEIIVKEVEGLYQIALENFEPAKAAKQQLELARLKIKEAVIGVFPKLEMQYSVTKGQTITDPYRSESYAVQLKHNLFDSGKSFKNVRKEKLNLGVARNEYEKTVQELKFEIIRSYLNILGKTEELKEIESFKKEALRDYDLAKDIYAVEAIPKIEFLGIDAEYQKTANMMVQIFNELQLAREKLRASMNLPSEAEVSISEINLPQLEGVDIDVEQCVQLALENKPDVKLWEISLESAKYTRQIARSEDAPSLELVTSYGASGEAYSDQTLDLAEEWKMMAVVTWLFGGSSFEVSGSDESVNEKNVTEISTKTEANTLSAKVSVMDKMQYYVQRKEADITYTQNLSNLSKNKQELIFGTRKSYLEYKQSLAEYLVSLFEDRFSRVNLELKKESFRMGKANLSEVVRARAEYIDKKMSLIRAKTSYYISLASLDNATSYSLGIFPFTETENY